MPTINQTDSQSLSNSSCRKSLNSSVPDFDIIANTPTVPDINHDAENIMEKETLIDNMLEKFKVDSIKKEIIPELQEGTEKHFQNEFLNHTQIAWFALKNWKKK